MIFMDTPDKEVQKAIISQALKAIETEAFSLKMAGEAFKSIGLTDKAEEKASQLATSMQLHSFYQKKLEELLG